MKIHKLQYVYEKPDYDEIYKVITYPEVYPNRYAVSNYGNIKNLKTGKIMKLEFDKDDHERVQLVTVYDNIKKRGYKQKHFSVHRLVLWEHVGPPPDEMHNIVSHENEIPCCNFVHNLKWETIEYNANHAKKYGRMNNSGVNAKVCKYDEKLIRKICRIYEKGYETTGKLYKASEVYEILTNKKDYKIPGYNSGLYNLINKLGKRTSYKDIVCDYNYIPNEEYFECDETISKLRYMILNGFNNYDILHEFGYNSPSDNKTFYNRIITERSKKEMLINDYRKVVTE